MISTILTMAKIIGVNGYILLAICSHETNLKNIYIKDDGGTPTIGVCGVKYETAKFLKFKGTEKDLMKPEINIKYAAKYLKWQKERYNGNLCQTIAAYNT